MLTGDNKQICLKLALSYIRQTYNRMKKIIIIVLAIILIVAFYFFFIAKEEIPKEVEIEEPVAGPIDLPVYPGAEFVARLVESAGDVSYYTVDAPLSEVAVFYFKKFPSFRMEEDPIFGYSFTNIEMENLRKKFKSNEEVTVFKEKNKGLVIFVDISSFDLVSDDYDEFIEDYKEKFLGKTAIAIAHF